MYQSESILVNDFRDVKISARKKTSHCRQVTAVDAPNELSFVVLLVEHFLEPSPV